MGRRGARTRARVRRDPLSFHVWNAESPEWLEQWFDMAGAGGVRAPRLRLAVRGRHDARALRRVALGRGLGAVPVPVARSARGAVRRRRGRRDHAVRLRRRVLLGRRPRGGHGTVLAGVRRVGGGATGRVGARANGLVRRRAAAVSRRARAAARQRRARPRAERGRALDGLRAQGAQEREEGAPRRCPDRVRRDRRAARRLPPSLPRHARAPRRARALSVPARLLRTPPRAARLRARAARRRRRVVGARAALRAQRVLVPRRHRQRRVRPAAERPAEVGADPLAEGRREAPLRARRRLRAPTTGSSATSAASPRTASCRSSSGGASSSRSCTGSSRERTGARGDVDFFPAYRAGSE